MDYEQLKPTYSAFETTVEQRLRAACDKRTAHGISGIRNLNNLGKPDGTVSFKDFYMHPDIFDLGCQIPGLDVDVWATWMMNSEVEISDNCVIIHSPNGFYAGYARSKLGGVISKHCGKPAHFKPNPILGKTMDKK